MAILRMNLLTCIWCKKTETVKPAFAELRLGFSPQDNYRETYGNNILVCKDCYKKAMETRTFTKSIAGFEVSNADYVPFDLNRNKL